MERFRNRNPGAIRWSAYTVRIGPVSPRSSTPEDRENKYGGILADRPWCATVSPIPAALSFSPPLYSSVEIGALRPRCREIQLVDRHRGSRVAKPDVTIHVMRQPRLCNNVTLRGSLIAPVTSARSSDGQSIGLRSRWSGVRVPPGAPIEKAVR